MSRSKRNIKRIILKKVILIACEGEKNKTEKQYFNNFCAKNRNYVIKIVPGNSTDPFNLVRDTVNYIKCQSVDMEAFCVIDLDFNKYDQGKNKQMFIKATKLAKKHNIKIIVSNPSIELWFLLHYEYTTAFMTNKEILKKLKEKNPAYNKNHNIYLDIKDNENIAIERAKKLEEFHKENNDNFDYLLVNPYTNIYELVEHINKID